MTIPNKTLITGQEMPMLGLGTWQLTGDTCQQITERALALGYRHIDTADMYGNHVQIKKGIQNSGVKRENLFITSKVPPEDLRYMDVLKGCQKYIEELDCDYLDMLLIHWPNTDIPIDESLSAFLKLIGDGKIKGMGVSNFTSSRLKKALAASELSIAVNQVECHPYLKQPELVDFCRQENVAVTAYSPLARGKIADDAVLNEIAVKHEKTFAQVALRWQIQRGVIVIPKTTSERHLGQNMDLFDWELDQEEMEKIDKIPYNKRLIDPFPGIFNE